MVIIRVAKKKILLLAVPYRPPDTSTAETTNLFEHFNVMVAKHLMRDVVVLRARNINTAEDSESLFKDLVNKYIANQQHFKFHQSGNTAERRRYGSKNINQNRRYSLQTIRRLQ